MGKITTTIINQFNGGIAKDKRLKDFRFFGLSKNFDISTYNHKLEPLRSLTPAETKNLEIVKFLVNPSYPGGAKIAGLGVPVGGAVAEVYHWSGTQWLASLSNNVSSIGARDTDVFFYYKGFIYMWGGGNSLKRMDATGTIAFNDSYQSISYTTVVQPLIHPNTGNAYFFSDNNIHILDGVNFSESAFSLSADSIIKSACVYGNYIAIACASANNINDTSVVYLWDLDTGIENLAESIDFGGGRIEYLATLDNQLVAVSYNHPKILIKALNGITSTIINELITDQSYFSIPDTTSQVIDNKLYFPASVQLDGNTRNGIWELRSNGFLSLLISDDSIGQIEGLFKTADNWWIAHSGDGSVDRTVDKNVNTFANAEYESIIIGNAYQNHKLISVGVMTEPLPANGEVILEYKKDTGLKLDVWTEIFSRNVDDTQYNEALRHDSDGSVLPTFKELQFKVTCKGGAVFTGLKFNLEELDNNLTR